MRRRISETPFEKPVRGSVLVYAVAVLTGLVYAAVILLWAVVLVPQWLRRHERNAEHRTTVTFHRAMRALERRRVSRGVSRARHDVDVTVAGARSRVHDRISIDEHVVSPIDQHLDEGVDPFEGSETEDQLRHIRRLRAESHARSTATQRRRQVQQILIGLSVVGLVLLVMGVLPLLVGLLPAVGLAAFVYASRGSARAASANQKRAQRSSDRDLNRGAKEDGVQRSSRERSSSSARRSSANRTSSSRSSSTRRSSSASRRSGAARHVDAPAARTTNTEYSDLEGADVRLLSASESAGRRASAASEGRWEPVEAPLPGYLDSARATRMPRNLDSTANGDWTSERMLEQAEALRTPGADAEFELGLDDFVDIPGADVAEDHGYDHRRAVND